MVKWVTRQELTLTAYVRSARLCARQHGRSKGPDLDMSPLVPKHKCSTIEPREHPFLPGQGLGARADQFAKLAPPP
eukprot:3568527-Pyramimonas_sp.AAC.1